MLRSTRHSHCQSCKTAGNRCKIVLVGPKKVGKSTVANCIMEQCEHMNCADKYNPTMGVRVLEMERDASEASGGKAWDGGGDKLEAELWDCSGDQRFVLHSVWERPWRFSDAIFLLASQEACWPAIMKDANGVIIMYNPDNREHEER